MRLVITIVATVCLGAHAFVGCCWSHLWHEDCCEAAVNSVDSHHKHAGESGCTHGHSHPEHQHAPGPCKCECRGTCNYLPTGKVELQHSEFVGYAFFLPLSEIGFEPIYPAESQELARQTPSAALPLRLHLLHQVLLV